MRDAIELAPQRVIQSRVSMAMNVAPERANPIEISAPVAIDQKVAFSASNHQRSPLSHLRERMPKYPLI
jgi:hypothetical protein